MSFRGRELLFSNSCLQFADLAIRKAWFSGGIEWNLGQLGHAFTTCEPLFAAVVETGTGSFLRCWEYERCKRLYWSIDFHLDDGDDFLSVYLRVVNPLKEAVPFYYWTNTAVPEEPDARIYSGSDDIIYIDQSSLASGARERLMAHGSLPRIDRIAPDRDFFVFEQIAIVVELILLGLMRNFYNFILFFTIIMFKLY